MDGWWLEALGWLGSAVIVWSLIQTQLSRLRVFNLVGTILLVGYNLVLGIWPMVGLNVVLAAINVWYLVHSRRDKHDARAYEVLEVDGDDTFLRHVLRVHGADILRFNPSFVHEPFGTDTAYLVLKGDETVGVMVTRDEGEGTVRLVLDYVLPRYRDLSPGEFVFGPEGPLCARGVRRVVVPADMVEPYYETLGLRRDGDTYLL
jgi:hypothetical protein